MNADSITRFLRAAADELGIDRLGVAPAGPTPHGEFVREWLDRGYAGTMSYLRRHVESRIDVRAWLPSTRSVIVAALLYNQKPPVAPPADDRARGRVALYAWGRDYHVVLRNKLEELVARLQTHVAKPFEARICVDTSAINERALAAAAGIGWIGKNTLVLHPRLGSYFFLGVVITDLSLVPDPPVPDHCGTCTRCLDACPTEAFPTPYVLDARRCISYLTIEHRKPIDPALALTMDDWVFGCDVCQQVCPFNADALTTRESAFRPNSFDDTAPVLEDLIAGDDAALRAYAEGRAADRARPAMWRRNAANARANRITKSAQR